MNLIVNGFKTIRQLGLLPVMQVGLYRFGLLTGHYRRVSESKEKTLFEEKIEWIKPQHPFLESEIAVYLRGHSELKEVCLEEARLVINGKCKIFGHKIVDIFQDGLDTSCHWTECASGKAPLPAEDIKFIWEPARLGWIYSLARAYAYNEIPMLGESAWRLIDTFLKRNPVDHGLNWMNGQEVALRIFALVFFHEIFRGETGMPEGWKQILTRAVVAHAQRIPPTLVYAQSQQNNHLLVEAAGLYTAGVFLQNHPEAGEWRKTGWQVFHAALGKQIQDDGTYAQYSTNYHRLMLQVALWMKSASLRAGDAFPQSSSIKLAAATNWLKNLTDADTGRVPNYGHNDGAYIFPLTGYPFHDFRSVVQTSEYFFGLEYSSIEPEEMILWFEWMAGSRVQIQKSATKIPSIQSYGKLVCGNSSAIMFAPLYTSRPGQADVLHTEIWRDGNPITLDAGTYHYNADPPWDNSLAQTKFHNTVTVFQQNQMQKAGRFLWLDWPNVRWQDYRDNPKSMAANQDGYNHLGVIHNRQVEFVNENILRVNDEICSVQNKNISTVDAWLQWLLPAMDWTITETGIQSGSGVKRIKILIKPLATDALQPIEIQLIRAGVLINIQPEREIPSPELVNFGWASPTYALKEPALSFRVLFRGKPPVKFCTEFQFG